ncbi:MAG TPA: hypothetical protein VFX53_17120 [Pedococcus sp.]|nr:hypothetical protein [Pedococcus sp.]
MAKIYKLDQYRAECNIEPFVLDTGETQIVIQAPTGETLFKIAETPTVYVQTLLKLITGDQFDAVWNLFRHEQGTVLVQFLKDIGAHFMVTSIAEAPGGSAALPN